MAKTRKEKEELVSEIADKLSNMKAAVFTSVSGYTMEDANGLRQKGAENGVEILITKKSLLLLALEKNGFKVNRDEFEGSILSTFGYDDEVSAAKIISEFSKGRDEIKVVGGVLEGQLVGADAIKQLATLPSREELLAKVVGSINAPVSGFVNVLAGNLRNLVYVLNSIKEAKA